MSNTFYIMSFNINFVYSQTHLALYCFANSQVSTALKFLYRARYLLSLICGENHPEMAILDVSFFIICIMITLESLMY